MRHRLDEISKLQDGWLDGEGLAPKQQELYWFNQMFEGNYDKNLPLPLIFPTPQGGIQAEWSIGTSEISLTINLSSKEATCHLFDFSTKEENTAALKLNESEGWSRLNAMLNNLLPA